MMIGDAMTLFDPVLPRFSFFVEVKFEVTVAFCRNKVCRSSRIRNNPPLSKALFKVESNRINVSPYHWQYK
jgi:hypothetical protein